MFSNIPLKEGEEIIYIIRKYGLTLLWWMLLIAALIGTPFFFMFWLFSHGWWGRLLFAVPVTLGVILLIRILFYWRKNRMIITTHGLVDIHYKNAFNKVVSRVDYDEMDDVSGEIKGLGGSIFRYGDITLNTGSGSVKVIKKKIKDPIGLQAEIKNMKRKYKRRSGKDPIEVIMENLKHLDKKKLIDVIKTSEKILKEKEEE